MITVYPGEIPEEGLDLSGCLEEDIFQLDEADGAKPAGPTRYDLNLMLSEDLILVQGRIEAPFTLCCVVCLETFPFTSRIDNYLADIDLEGAGSLDLTERIREDLLLNLPAYPHCDQGDDPDRVCPMAGKFAASGDESGEPEPSAWDALDALDSKGKTGD